jgi:nucleotide-binding universal stress UspA family protein
MNTKTTTVLAATDLSRPAFAAVRRAALIARAHDARLEIVHVIPDSLRSAAWHSMGAPFAQMEADVRSLVAADLQALVAQIESEIGIKAHATVTAGKPFAQIAARSEEIAADVIVVGAHGENVLTTPLLGTTAHRVLRLARRPVLLVKRTPSVEHGAKSEYDHIVVATDFSEDSMQAARSARRLFPRSSMTIFHAYEAPFESKLAGRVSEQALHELRGRALAQAHRELEVFASAAGLSHAARVARHGIAGVRIREYASDTSGDLIAIGSEEVPRLQAALLGSVSLDIVTQASCDVLLARGAAA